MRCPYCGNNDDKVIDSRETDHGKVIRRRRECKACDKRWTTRESVDESIRLTVVKRGQTRVPYDRQKMLTGIQAACYKRPVALDTLTAIVDETEEELFKLGQREVGSTDIGLLLAQKLKRVDHVAYIRFASVYLRFENIDDLIEEAQDLKATAPPPEEPDQGALF